MGCVSSKLVAKEVRVIQTPRRNLEADHPAAAAAADHVVSLTSSTYGVLNLDKEKEKENDDEPEQPAEVTKQQIINEDVLETKQQQPSPPREEPSEIINAWELMEGLEEEVSAVRRSPKSRLFDARSPLKFMNQIGSPRKVKKVVGKENKVRGNGGIRSLENSPKLVLKECSSNSVKKPSPRLWASIKGSPTVKRCNSLRIDTSGVVLSRKSLGPLLDPSLQKEEELKKVVSVSSSPTSWKDKHSQEAEAMLDSYKRKCPPGGINAVVIYTTTLRGIRKTFEDCNIARSIIESQNVQMIERDVSMHSGYREELRALMNSKDVKVPLVFVKGRLIGGAEEMVKLDEGGKLGILFDGIPKAAAACSGCGGFRFVMCTVCNGSCKLLGKDGKKSVRCNKCNENGLIQCPFCSS
ncbi:uncharacterized protein At5g39865 [Andrographis paniculata]|uniref:uncharacterized protein At5g39865 n=1 Tax=Andrographis paniculata TaxID=175694 RepID=UPI0021E83BB3|nr:uncharacterized protein At5g39865 [Andrographis paniculata]